MNNERHMLKRSNLIYSISIDVIYIVKVVMEFWQAIGGDEEEMRSSDENSD